MDSGYRSYRCLGCLNEWVKEDPSFDEYCDNEEYYDDNSCHSCIGYTEVIEI